MNNKKIYSVSYMGKDKKEWVKKQLVLKHRNAKRASTFLDLDDIYQSKRNREADLKQCGIKTPPKKFADIGRIKY